MQSRLSTMEGDEEHYELRREVKEEQKKEHNNHNKSPSPSTNRIPEEVIFRGELVTPLSSWLIDLYHKLTGNTQARKALQGKVTIFGVSMPKALAVALTGTAALTVMGGKGGEVSK